MNFIKKFLSLFILIIGCSAINAMEADGVDQKDKMELGEVTAMSCDEDEAYYLPVELESVIANFLADLTVSIDQIIDESKDIMEAIQNINRLFFNVSNVSSTFKEVFLKHYVENVNYAVFKIRKKFPAKEDYIKIFLKDSKALEDVKSYVKIDSKNAIVELVNASKQNRLIAVAALLKAGMEIDIKEYEHCKAFLLFLLKQENLSNLKFLINISKNKTKKMIQSFVRGDFGYCSAIEQCKVSIEQLEQLLLERSKCIYKRYRHKILNTIFIKYPQALVYYLAGYRSFRLDFIIDLRKLDFDEFEKCKQYIRELDIPIKIKCKNARYLGRRNKEKVRKYWNSNMSPIITEQGAQFKCFEART